MLLTSFKPVNARQLPSWLVRLLHTGPGAHATGDSLARQYDLDVEAGTLQAVPSQQACVQQLTDLLNRLPAHAAAVASFNSHVKQYREQREALHARLLREEQDARRREDERLEQEGAFAGYLRRFWRRRREDGGPAEAQHSEAKAAVRREEVLDEMLGPEPAAPVSPRGLYIHGSVGSGKTMLMDRFYDQVKATGAVPFSRRLHFNAALLEVHHLMHQQKQSIDEVLSQEGKAGKDPEVQRQKHAKLARLAVRRYMRQRLRRSSDEIVDSIARSNAAIFGRVAQNIIQGMDGQPESVSDEVSTDDDLVPGLLCFDEVGVNDPFTALALKGVFEALMDAGTVIVATSNRAPPDLNHFGVHEAIFTHFKQRLEEACRPIDVSSPDFRRSAGGGSVGEGYIWPLDGRTAGIVEARWLEAVSREETPVTERRISVMFGRELQVARAAGGVARFDFSELCDAPKGAADYYALAQRFHTVFLTGVPVMSLQKRNLARRFIVLLDELYNARVALVCQAAAPPEELFAATADDDQAVFDPEQLEQLQFESAAEGSRLRRNVMAEGGVAPLLAGGTATVTSSHLGGLEEQFAFARAISRLYEMSRPFGTAAREALKQTRAVL